MGFMLRGIAVSEGIGFGHARLVTNTTLNLSDYTQQPESPEIELSRFDKAIKTVETELVELQSSSALTLPEEFSMFLLLRSILSMVR